MATIKTLLLGAGLIALLIVAVGYLSAWSSLSSCTDRTFEKLRREGISGTDMLGRKVAIDRESVTASIVGPFMVETRYMVPFDMHGSLHFKQYLALPWAIHERSTRVSDLVVAPAVVIGQSANYSSKPTPLRGAA
ncbi:hypothetical protein [Xanthomonas oryzae]|uniref:hypothetical protein n=1 Tax=Xanthomonas oryzae TaxID=347 RepID=UPI001035338E|nr:hypothetical protein [Xanthomonas oryzae]QBH04134.1 hypothetical protein EYC57_13085 [Xanthomonas oryzae]